MHIIIIDDHELVRDGIKTLVEQEFGWHVLFDVAAIEELPNADVLADVDVAIIDISLQEASGFDVLNTIKTNYPDVRWLIVHLVLSPAAVMVCVWLFRKYNRRPFFDNVNSVVIRPPACDIDNRECASALSENTTTCLYNHYADAFNLSAWRKNYQFDASLKFS